METPITTLSEATPTILSIPLDLIDDNPWQAWQLDESIVAALTVEYATGHDLPPVLLRPHPKDADRYQTVYGHHRRAARRRAGFDAIPAVVRPLTDLEMVTEMYAEQFKRHVPNALDKATAISVLVKPPFNLNQAEAGQFFGLTNQGAVSNVLSILKHSDEVKQLIRAGTINERQARDLRLADRLDRKSAIAIAQAAAKEPERERGEYINARIVSLIRQKGHDLADAPFDLNWPKTPIAVDKPDTVKGEPAEIVACKGCPFNFTYNERQMCGNPACYDRKAPLGLQTTLAARSKALGIPVAAPDETTHIVYNGNEWMPELGGKYNGYDAREKAKKFLLTKKPIPELRLMLVNGKSNGWDLEDLTGSRFIALVATNKAAVIAVLPTHTANGRVTNKFEPPANESEAAKAKRLEREEKERDERREARALFNRAKADTLWLIENAAGQIAGRITITGGVLSVALNAIKHAHNPVNCPDYFDLERKFGVLKPNEDDASQRVLLAMRVIAARIFNDYNAKPEKQYDWARAQREVEGTAEDKFAVKLPTGWNKPPVHRTHFNCWSCGVFASNPAGLTKREIEQGWKSTGPAATAHDVYCPTCAKKPVGAGLVPAPKVAPMATTKAGKGGAMPTSKKGKRK